jgi:hypothetical protein
VTTLEWAAIVVGAVGGWASVSWAMGKVKELNSRPSPFDAAQAGTSRDNAGGRPVSPEPRSRADAE